MFGVGILSAALWRFFHATLPDAETMTLIGLLAFAVNLFVALLLFKYRNGDSNMRSVWLCTRNDALGNLAVVIAAVGVFGTQSHWPDLLVAGFIASLALTSSYSVIRQARCELQLAASID
jgi:Co/Zn/Cd efflux system component